MINHTSCSNQHVTMEDNNYRQILNYFRHCFLLVRLLSGDERRTYLNRMNGLLQETWYDFIWRTELSSKDLVKMQAFKETLMKQSEDIISKSRHGAWTSWAFADSSTALDYSFMTGRALAVIVVLTILILLVKLVLVAVQRNRKKRKRRRYYRDDCESELDVRMVNEDPPKISPSGSEDHLVFYETHFLFCGNDKKNKDCSIPTQVHIKKCCSHQANCNKAPQVVLKRCKVHEGRRNVTKTCRHGGQLQKRKELCKKMTTCLKKVKLNKCFNGLDKKNDDMRQSSTHTVLSITSSGVSMSEELIPVFMTVRKLRLDDTKKIGEDQNNIIYTSES